MLHTCFRHGKIPAQARNAALCRALWQIHVAAMREYVAATWGWNNAYQAAYFRNGFRSDHADVIEVDGRTVGVLVVERGPDELFLSTIELDHLRSGAALGQRSWGASNGRPTTEPC